jgi:cystathionine beta-lyase family protein involved in aluminum resistance
MTVPAWGEREFYAASYAPFAIRGYSLRRIHQPRAEDCTLFARAFENAEYHNANERCVTSVIIQSLECRTKKRLWQFCQSIQKAAPVDSFALPEPWDMPLQYQVVMAGDILQGASIELSADAPIREPYIAYIQGGLTLAHGRLGAMLALDALYKCGQANPQ